MFIVLIIYMNRLLDYWDNLPPRFDQDKLYTIVPDEKNCILRLKDPSGKESWIAGSSTRAVRQYIDQSVTVKANYIYTDKLPSGSPKLLSLSDDCEIQNKTPYMLTVHIESIVASK